MGKRTAILAETVPPYSERRARIEAEPLPVNIAALIDAAAEDAGEKLLWNFFESGETITYSELRRTTQIIARNLHSLGVAKGAHVAVMLPNIAAFPLAWLSIGTLGAVMIPVNVSYRERELEHVVQGADAAWMIVHDSCVDVVEGALAQGRITLARERIIVVGDAVPPGMRSWSGLLAGPRAPFHPPYEVGHDDLLNIQFTSGTSGFPKGCMLTQRYWISSGKVNAFRDGRRYERILASTPFFYMDPQWLLLMTIYQRGTLFVAARQSTSRFLDWLRRFRIEFCLFPWVLANQPADPSDADNEIVRCNVYGVPRDLHHALEARFDLNAREAFGMTEIGPSMFMPVERADMVGSGSCGLPCPFRECRIVDERGHDVPPGEIGELIIRGPGIMKGYYRNPEATCDVLRDGWFHTGDLFRQDREGFFYIVGRKKDMIRRSAENIAAREVEVVLNALPAVQEAAVIAVPDALRGEEVKAYVKLKEGVSPTTETVQAIIDGCGAGLAPFKVPRFVAFIDEFPRTASLKIAKPQLSAGIKDLRAGSFDRVAGGWLPEGAAEAETA